MAKDDFGWLVNVVEEEGTFPELKVWAIVPGGLLFGTLVSQQRFFEHRREIETAGGMSLEEGMLRAEMTLVVADVYEKYKDMLPNDHVEACFIDVQIFSGGVAFHPSRVRVRVSEVSAWGIGAVPEDFYRSKKQPAQ